MKRIALKLALIALMASAIGAGTAPAFATARSAPTITIVAKSAIPKITGDVLVIWRSAADGSATISGTVTGGSSGEVLRLYAKQFPFTQAPKVVGKITTSGPTQPYSFTVAPGLATRYQAKLFATSTSHVSLAASPTVAVFVHAAFHARGGSSCNAPGQRPVCHQTWHLHIFVPPSTLRTEMPKRWFIYFGINLSRTGEPPLPKILKLGAGNPRVSRPVKINAHEYAVTIKLSFRIGNDGYHYAFNPCQRDTEAKDGLNLPGHHGCGTLKEIRRTRQYLG
jgi:hypothetical protein